MIDGSWWLKKPNKHWDRLSQLVSKKSKMFLKASSRNSGWWFFFVHLGWISVVDIDIGTRSNVRYFCCWKLVFPPPQVMAGSMLLFQSHLDSWFLFPIIFPIIFDGKTQHKWQFSTAMPHTSRRHMIFPWTIYQSSDLSTINPHIDSYQSGGTKNNTHAAFFTGAKSMEWHTWDDGK